MPEAMPGEVPDPARPPARMPVPSALPCTRSTLRGRANRRSKPAFAGRNVASLASRGVRAPARPSRGADQMHRHDARLTTQSPTRDCEFDRTKRGLGCPTFRTRTIRLDCARVAIALGATTAGVRRDEGSNAGATLVVDHSFEIKTADPQRHSEPTAAIVNRGIFDTIVSHTRAATSPTLSPTRSVVEGEPMMRRRSPFQLKQEREVR